MGEISFREASGLEVVWGTFFLQGQKGPLVQGSSSQKPTRWDVHGTCRCAGADEGRARDEGQERREDTMRRPREEGRRARRKEWLRIRYVEEDERGGGTTDGKEYGWRTPVS